MSIKINHIAIVVENVEEALTVYRDTLGLSLDHISEEPAEQVRVAFLPVANGNIELVQPTTSESKVAKFLAKRGEGFHHLCLEVDNINDTVQKMAAQGLEVLGEPRYNERGDKYIFIHPKSVHGLLLELYERSAD